MKVIAVRIRTTVRIQPAGPDVIALFLVFKIVLQFWRREENKATWRTEIYNKWAGSRLRDYSFFPFKPER